MDEVGELYFNYWNCRYLKMLSVDCGSNRLVGRGECRGASPTKRNSYIFYLKTQKQECLLLFIIWTQTHFILGILKIVIIKIRWTFRRVDGWQVVFHPVYYFILSIHL